MFNIIQYVWGFSLLMRAVTHIVITVPKDKKVTRLKQPAWGYLINKQLQCGGMTLSYSHRLTDLVEPVFAVSVFVQECI